MVYPLSALLELATLSAGIVPCRANSAAPSHVCSQGSECPSQMRPLEVGSWHCDEENRVGARPRFSSLQLVDLNEDPVSVFQQLQAAQRGGYPVLLRKGIATTSASQSKHSSSEIEQVASAEYLEVLGKNNVTIGRELGMYRFDRTSLDWAGQVAVETSDLTHLQKQLSLLHQEEGKQMARKHDSEENIRWSPYEFSASVKHLRALVHRNRTKGINFNMHLDDESLIPVLKALGINERYPLFEGDTKEYMTLFIQPKTTSGAHLDDLGGATYFFLHLLEGRKVMRTWPFFEHGELEAWGCSQRDWDIAVVPDELFLRGEVRKGFSSSRWTPDGFEYGILNEEAYNKFDWDKMCKKLLSNSSVVRTNAGRCFVEVEMQPGDEVFVPSGIPHQFSTLEPSSSVSGNFRFRPNYNELSADKLQHLFNEIGMQKPRDLDVEELDIAEVGRAILRSKDFDLAKWQQIAEKHKPESWLELKPNSVIGKRSSKAWNVVANVLLSTFKGFL